MEDIGLYFKPMSIKNEIKEYALSLGIHLVAVAPVEVYTDFLNEAQKRLQDTGTSLDNFMISPVANKPLLDFAFLSDPRKSLPAVKSIIIIGVYYYDKGAVYRNTVKELKGKTAKSYRYYPVLRKICDQVVAFIENKGYKAVHGQHIPLKHVADRIGLGVYGKNGVFQTPKYGSCIAFRNILTEAELPADRLEKPLAQCENCDKCLKACPTKALYAPYKVNPKMCINPITRRADYIKPEIRLKMRNWIHGCDICQDVCPANRNLSPREVDPRSGFEPAYHVSHRNLDGLERTPSLLALLAPKYPEIIRRNAAIALANIGKDRKKVLMALKEQLDNVSAELKEYFTWAIERIETKKN